MQDRYGNEPMTNGAGAGTFILGCLCGAAVGAALGLLFAPKSGVELRRQLSDQAGALRQRAVDQTSWIRDRASEMYGGVAETVQDMASRGREALQVGREAFQKSRPHNGPTGDMTGMGMP